MSREDTEAVCIEHNTYAALLAVAEAAKQAQRHLHEMGWTHMPLDNALAALEPVAGVEPQS